MKIIQGDNLDQLIISYLETCLVLIDKVMEEKIKKLKELEEKSQ
jgi:hypothetical protein